MAKGQHHWSESVKAAVIGAYEAGMPITEVAKTYGVPHPTVCSWTRNVPMFLRQKADDVKKELDLKLEELAHKAVGLLHKRIDDETLNDSTLNAAMGTAIDKMRLLREQATSITGEVPSTVEECDKIATELLDRAKLRLVKTGTEG
jgi:transposase-like protein